MKRILFVCTGNICRSPMAEGIFNHQAKEYKRDNEISAWSAGTYAMDKDKVTKHSASALKDLGIDISHHQAQHVSYENLESSCLILTMTASHKFDLIKRFPEFSDKVFTIYEFTENDNEKNIEDPYGLPLETYVACAIEIKIAVSKVWEKL